MKRLIQISDPHIMPPGENYHDIDTKKNFLDTLERAQLTADDLLVLSGDLAGKDGGEVIYHWIAEQCSKLPCPVLYMTGNHDIPSEMEILFQSKNSLNRKAYGDLMWNDLRLIFLDTADYTLPEDQVEFLNSISDKKDTLLFIHHPPTPCDFPYMDTRYPLKNRDEVWPTIKSVPGLKAIFCGHYHIARSLVHEDIPVHVCPSSAYQIVDIDVDNYDQDFRPGFCEILVDASSSEPVKTRVEMLEI